jgi:hypothetical protein
VPPASGLPPNSAKRLVDAPPAQVVKAPSRPASGLVFTVTVTVLCAPGQGATAAISYVYTPPLIEAGSKRSPTIALGPLQVPPASGPPPSSAKRLIEALLSHKVTLPSTPASGTFVTVTVTVALASTHGAVPVTE